MLTTTIAETLHAKDPVRFGKLVAGLLEAGLLRAHDVRRRRIHRRRRGAIPSRSKSSQRFSRNRP